jgi:DNA-binding transcriptional LysR family regulator
VDALNSMRVFVKVAEFNSFARASEALDMAVPRTSRVISELEDHLGTRLLQRTTRKMSLTEPGRIYLERCRQILGEIEETYLMLSANAVSTSGRIRVAAPALFAQRKLAPVLAAYQRAYPDVIVDLVLADRPVDLIEEEFDLGILAARRINSVSLVSRHLTTTDYYICAALYCRAWIPRAPVGVGRSSLPRLPHRTQQRRGCFPRRRRYANLGAAQNSLCVQQHWHGARERIGWDGYRHALSLPG